MAADRQIASYLKRVGSLLVMGEDGGTVQRVADGILSDPEDVVKSVRVWKLQGGSIVLDYNAGESIYPPEHKLPASYEPIKVARRDGYIIVTPDDPCYRPELEGQSKCYALIYWQPDRLVSVELRPEKIEQKGSVEILRRLSRTFEKSMKFETFDVMMEEARFLQEAMLPPKKIEASGYDISWKYEPSRIAGGDFLFLGRLNHAFMIGIGDSEGKGLEAARNASISVSYLRGFTDANPVSEINAAVDGLNRNLMLGRTRKSVTLYVAKFKPDGRFDYVNAGHIQPVFVKKDGSLGRLQDGNPLLGVFDSEPYDRSSHRLDKDDVLFMCTDGLTESVDESDEFYPEERLEGVLKDTRTMSSEEILMALEEDSKRFRGAQDLLDDRMMLAMKYRG
jgi:serine phosphatase RsbU (regulator of sigma subunit)